MLIPAALYPYPKEHHPEANENDWIVFGLFFLGGIPYYNFSVTNYVITSHSQKAHDIFLMLNLFNVTIVTAGCFPPRMWYKHSRQVCIIR